MDLEKDIIRALKQVYDPEIPADIYSLGLIYSLEVNAEKKVLITMTLTAPNCPMADDMVQEVYDSVKAVPGVKDVAITLTYEPQWEPSRMTEEAKLACGLL